MQNSTPPFKGPGVKMNPEVLEEGIFYQRFLKVLYILCEGLEHCLDTDIARRHAFTK